MTVTVLCAVIFDTDGGTVIPALSVACGGYVAQPSTDPEKDGFGFNEWYTTPDGLTVFSFTTQNITADCAIYAKWVPIYLVTYDKNGGTGSVPVDTKEYRNGDTATVAGNIGNLTRGGYEFGGWNTNNAGTGTQCDAGSRFVVSGPVLLYARWRKLCAITFDGDGATMAPTPSSVHIVEGATVGTLPTGQAKTGYQFDGWWTGKKGTGTQVVAATVVNGDIVTFARWIIKDYDGNTYTDVTIGTQTWMAENLKVTHYRDGTEIDGYSFYNNDQTNKDKYGALYGPWVADAVYNVNNVAPIGWRVPDDTDWDKLRDYLVANGFNHDGSTSGNKTGKAMASTSDWSYSGTAGDVGNNVASNNKSGFSAEPAGYFYNSTHAEYSGLGEFTIWWSSTDMGDITLKNYYRLKYNLASFDKDSPFPLQHCSIRLTRDY